MTYEVTGLVATFSQGEHVSDEQLTGCNVAALVAGGFLREVADEVLTAKPAVNPSPIDVKPAETKETSEA